MSIRAALFVATLFVACPAGAQTGAPGVSLLVSTAWLTEHLRDPNLVVLHTSQGSSLLYFAARYAGLNASNYVGSWSEWVARKLPVEPAR